MADRLTGEELHVMELLARGLTRTEAAEALYISEDQIRRIIERALNCLGARRAITAVAWLTRIGAIDPLERESPEKAP